MTRDPDDEALSWGGDDDPTLAPGWKTVGRPVPLAGGPDEASDAATGAVNGEAETAISDSEGDGPVQTGSVELVVLGVLGGIYLLYTIGWLITALRTTAPGRPTVFQPGARVGSSSPPQLSASSSGSRVMRPD